MATKLQCPECGKSFVFDFVERHYTSLDGDVPRKPFAWCDKFTTYAYFCKCGWAFSKRRMKK